MAALRSMPEVRIDPETLKRFGTTWAIANPDLKPKPKPAQALSRTSPNSSSQLGKLFDTAVGEALAEMLGGIPIATPKSSMLATMKDCVEVGPVRIIGGVRPQSFDVGYRPDGVRIAFDSKTLNDQKSLGKNWQNMINDLATEATTVHSRFPHAVVAFMFICPEPLLKEPKKSAIIETLERLSRRVSVEDPLHMAEVISVVIWNPEDGTISQTVPNLDSPLRLEKFSSILEPVYRTRYKGLPPHAVDFNTRLKD
jgi:hypothetical protein